MKRLFVVLACLATAIGGSARAEPTKLRFILDWKAQGPGAWYYFARDKGYFAAEGLDVTIDQGDGSAAAVAKIMSGTYDAGFGDINAVIQNAAQRPGEQPVMVYLVYNRAPYALIVKADGPIKTLKDMEGTRWQPLPGLRPNACSSRWRSRTGSMPRRSKCSTRRRT
jgi:NitT/TauT family transport system substrate-binding protein